MRVRYTGRVQGVGFRATAQRLAAALAVSGWVRNEPDGSVLLEAQGREHDVRELLGRISQALSRQIAAAWTDELPELPGESPADGFHITR
ncbi:MAG: acylphosphatase [Planctomyces sp.]|nr:acylphosphatase [Planctomyces sp.]MBA4119451.1 acylphosphatase [Isosphaera sp.]